MRDQGLWFQICETLGLTLEEAQTKMSFRQAKLWKHWFKIHTPGYVEPPPIITDPEEATKRAKQASWRVRARASAEHKRK